jgi:lysophospholipase L1-like esterase
VEIARGEARSVRVQPASRLAVHNWADRLYAAMPPIGYQPPADRFDRLRRVRSKLREGRDVTIICLGDSIMNDTGNSTLDVLLERAYRYRGDASVRVLTAVGSGAGMQHWNDDLNRNWPGQDLDLAQAVLARKPDLVMIGGISTRGGFHHFEQIVDRIRVGVEGRYGYWPDVLLMTGPFGRRADSPAWRERRRVRQAESSAALREVARRKHTAFFDIAGAVDRYIADAQEAGWQPADFYRDGVHANHYGKQLLGRLLLDHLGP